MLPYEHPLKALESMAQLAGCEFSRDAVKKHLDTVSLVGQKTKRLKYFECMI